MISINRYLFKEFVNKTTNLVSTCQILYAINTFWSVSEKSIAVWYPAVLLTIWSTFLDPIILYRQPLFLFIFLPVWFKINLQRLKTWVILIIQVHICSTEKLSGPGVTCNDSHCSISVHFNPSVSMESWRLWLGLKHTHMVTFSLCDPSFF